MKGLLLSAFLLLSVLLAKADPPIQCPDGWTPVENPTGSGNWECQRVITVCPGDGTTPESKRNYFDTPTSTQVRCCPTARQLVIYDQNSRVGICCAAGLVYVGTAPNGLCCVPGQILQGGKCVDPPPPGPQEGCPSQPNNVCKLKKACGSADANGLQYGSCYQIAFPVDEGTQLGRGSDTASDVYKMGGHIQNIPYKICKSTTDCGTGAVQAADTFYIQDQIGLLNDATSTATWLNNAADPALITATTAAAAAGQFRGQTSCSACKCVVSMTGIGKGLAFRGDPADSTLTLVPNKQAVVDLEFSQIPCDNSVVVGLTANLKVPILKLQAQVDGQIPLVGVKA